MNELEFLRYLLHKVEECGLEDTYLNDIVKCRRIIEERIDEVKELTEPSVYCRSIPEITQKIYFYKSEEKRFEQLSEKYPNDLGFQREFYGSACKVFALEWVLLTKTGN